MIEAAYRQAFEDELKGLEGRRARDPDCSIADLSGILDNLYIMDGNNWDGRGEIVQTTLAATIAAYEYFIGEWRRETT